MISLSSDTSFILFLLTMYILSLLLSKGLVKLYKRFHLFAGQEGLVAIVVAFLVFAVSIRLYMMYVLEENFQSPAGAQLVNQILKQEKAPVAESFQVPSSENRPNRF